MIQRCLAFAFLCCCAIAQAEPPCAALYCPALGAQAFVALAETRLSASRAVRLLDRANIDKVLKEQGLALSGLVAAEDALKAGRLLQVDLFVALEMVQGAKAPFGVVVYDAKLGRRLVDRGLPEGSVEAVAAELAKTVEQAAAKMADTPKDAVALCVMPIRNVGLPDDLGYLLHAVHALLQRALVQNPSVVVLERSYLGYRNAEGRASALMGSAALLELELVKAPSGVSVRGALVAADGKKLADIAAEPDKFGADSIVAAIFPELAGKLQLKDAVPPPLNRGREAIRFRNEAQILQNSGDFAAAIGAAEAARAFANWDEVAATLASCQLAEAVRLLVGTRRDAPRSWNDIRSKRPEDVDQAFVLGTKALVTFMASIADLGKGGVPMAVKSYRYFDWSFTWKWAYCSEPLRRLVLLAQEAEEARAGNPDVRARFQALARDYALAIRQSPLDVALKKYDDDRFLSTFWHYSGDLATKLEMLRSLDKDKPGWVADAWLLLEPFLTTCDQHRGNLYAAYNRLTALGYFSTFHDPGVHVNELMDSVFHDLQLSYLADPSSLSDPSRPFAKFMAACRKHPFGAIRIHAAGMDMLASIRGEGVPADQALARFLRVCDQVLDERGKAPGCDIPMAESYEAVSKTLGTVAGCEVLGTCFYAELETLRLMAKRKEICGDTLDRRLAGVYDKSKMGKLLKDLELAATSPDVRVEANTPAGRQPLWTIQAMAQRCGVPLRRRAAGKLAEIWGRRRVLLGPDKGLMARSVVVSGKQAYLAVLDIDSAAQAYRLCRVDLDNGDVEALAPPASLNGGNFEPGLTRGALGGGYYCLSGCDAGIFVCDLKAKQVKLFAPPMGRPNPSTDIAWLDGKFYVSFDSLQKGGCFAELDPVSGAWRLLGSAGGRDTTSPFDNTTKRINVMAMVACPESHCVLFGVLEQCGGSGPYKNEHRDGLYSYTPAAGKFKHLNNSDAARISPASPFSGFYFLRDNHHRSAELYDAVGGTRTIYNYSQATNKRVRPKPMAPGISPNLPPRTDRMNPLALIDKHLWTAAPFGRVSLSTGQTDCFPAAIGDYWAQVLPVGDGKQVLVSGDCGLVLLDMTGAD